MPDGRKSNLKPLLSVFIRTDLVAFFKFAAKITGTGETCFYGNDGDRFCCRIKKFGSLHQTVLYQVGYGRNLDAGLENLQGTAFADGSCCGNFF